MRKLNSYFSNLIFIWLSILIYFTVSYYSNFLILQTKIALLIFAVGYTLIGLAFHLSHEYSSPSKGLLIIRYLRRFFSGIRRLRIERADSDEKNAMLFGIVKFFFLPIMLNFLFNNFSSLAEFLPRINLSSFTINGFNLILFPILLTFLFFIDTLIFSFGYTFESGILKNKLRSVEPTLFGWVVALACYPPFNTLIGKVLNWYSNDYYSFNNEIYTFILRIFIVILISIYVSASVALGTKASNLTNRGIVSKGPYAIVRHPAYISKNLAWWITIIPLGSFMAILSMAGWSLIYHLRAITEEKHLKKDPDYIKYCKKVKYRYIPGVY
jgi:protein-S-isoprenylcysteine O-methyltransferase Ste14